MRSSDAVKLLCDRARQNLARLYHLNRAGDKNHCLKCGESAVIRERREPLNVFCDADCQRVLHGLDSLLALGMKRGLNQVVQLEINWPDDVLIRLLEQAYGNRLATRREYEELLEMTTVNQQFNDIITLYTIPHIRYLCSEILLEISDTALQQFTGLRRLCMADDYAINVRESSISHFHSLTVLVLRRITLPADAFAALRSLEKLVIQECGVSNELLETVTPSLLSLTVRDESHLNAKCLAHFSALQSLTLANTVRRFSDINACGATLKHLTVGPLVGMWNSGVQQLANLESLDLSGASAAALDENCLVFFPRLQRLLLDNYTGMRLGGPVALDSLQELSIGGRCRVSLGDASQFRGLTSLSLNGRTDLAIAAGMFDAFPQLLSLDLAGTEIDVPLPATLETLALSTAAQWVSLPRLTALHVVNFEDFDDDDALAQLPQLEVLSIVGHCDVTENGLSRLVNLREFTLVAPLGMAITYAGVRALRLAYYYDSYFSKFFANNLADMKESGVRVFDAASAVDIDDLPPHLYEGVRRALNIY